MKTIAATKTMLAVAMALALLFCSMAHAQTWPAKPVRIIVPFPPGNGADIIGRLLAERLTTALGQTFYVENRPGAGSMVGTAYAAKAPADGYTLLIGGSSAMLINPQLFAHPRYDTLKDFAPITNIASLPMIIAVNPSFPAHTVPELISYAKQHPKMVTYGSSGIGSSNHLLQALFAAVAGIQITHIPYKGSAASMTDLIGGNITMITDTLPAVLPFVKTGQVRPLGILSAHRSPFAPDLPTLDEQGVHGVDITAWSGLFAPRGTPTPILDKLNAETIKALKKTEVQQQFNKLSMTMIGDSRADFERFIKEELTRWGQAVKTSGVKLD
ncbi:Bug family tripartite tricarboxylate transporter substrate binding protein [Paralcaligenes ginsengisoli]